MNHFYLQKTGPHFPILNWQTWNGFVLTILDWFSFKTACWAFLLACSSEQLTLYWVSNPNYFRNIGFPDSISRLNMILFLSLPYMCSLVTPLKNNLKCFKLAMPVSPSGVSGISAGHFRIYRSKDERPPLNTDGQEDPKPRKLLRLPMPLSSC